MLVQVGEICRCGAICVKEGDGSVALLVRERERNWERGINRYDDININQWRGAEGRGSGGWERGARRAREPELERARGSEAHLPQP